MGHLHSDSLKPFSVHNVDLFWTELNCIWVRDLPGPMHLGLRTGPLCPMFCTKLEEPCSFSKVPVGPYTYFPDILRVQKEGTKLRMSGWSQCRTLAQNVDGGFLLSTTFPTSGVITQPHYTGLFISPSGISELDCATTKTDTAERSISIDREFLQVFFCTRGLGVLAGSTARG